MTKNLQTAIDALSKLSAAEQETAAQAILDYATHDGSVKLADEQAVEVERRIKATKRTFISTDKARARLRRAGYASDH